MALLSLEDIEQRYGERNLLNQVQFLIDAGDRVGIVGANGSGKSTLLRIMAGVEVPDAGVLSSRRGLRLGYLEQDPVLDENLSVRANALQGLAGRDQVLVELEAIHEKLAEPLSPEAMDKLLSKQADLEIRLDSLGGHDVEHRVEALIHSLGLSDPDANCAPLSGGERRRVALARLLLSDPDLLLLDEPTNHLDTEVIAWLEAHLLQSRAALVLVTHDRYFLDRVVNRIVEIDAGQVHEYRGSYVDYLQGRADRLARENREESSRQNLLRRETEWMRRGPPARTTKSKARIQRYQDLVSAAPDAGQDELSFKIPCQHRLGNRVIHLQGVGKSFGGRSLFSDLDLEIGNGERLGIIGPNGAGKTSLLRICLQELAADQGQVKLGPTLQFSYIDQSRQDLDPNKTVLEELGQGNDHVFVDGRSIRLESYLESFLFPSRLFRTAVGELSGGEKNRLLIAKLLAIGGNVLVLDEPTNDLDLMTLRVLEEALIAFAGSAIIVSHDRWFLDRVATKILHLGIDGRHRVHHGDLSDLLAKLAQEASQEQARAKSRLPQAKTGEPKTKNRKLSTRERAELEKLPDQIHAREAELQALDLRLADPELYTAGSSAANDLSAERKNAEERLQKLYARWEELEAIA